MTNRALHLANESDHFLKLLRLQRCHVVWSRKRSLQCEVLLNCDSAESDCRDWDRNANRVIGKAHGESKRMPQGIHGPQIDFVVRSWVFTRAMQQSHIRS